MENAKMMKNRVNLAALVLGTTFVITGCRIKIEEPVKSHYDSMNLLPAQIAGQGKVYLLDMNDDGQVDCVKDSENIERVIYAARGYGEKCGAIRVTRDSIMTDGMRDAFSKLFLAEKNAGFETAKKQYSDYKKESEKER